MMVKSIRGEVINLSLVGEYKLDGVTLIVRDSYDKLRKYTLTEESANMLQRYIDSIEKE